MYATVFLYKARCAGAFRNDVQRQEVAELVLRFIAAMKEASSIETHICHGYSQMLRQLWQGHEASDAYSRATRPQSNTDNSRYGQGEFENVAESARLPLESSPGPIRADQDSPAWDWNSLGNVNPYFTSGTLGQRNDITAFPTIEAYPFGSFWPDVTDYWDQQASSADEVHQVVFGDTGMGFSGMM